MKQVKTMSIFLLVLAMAVSTYMPAFAAYDKTTTEMYGSSWTFTSVNMESGYSIDTSKEALGTGSMKLTASAVNTKLGSCSTTLKTVFSAEYGKRYSIEFDSKAKNASSVWVQVAKGNWVSLTPTGGTYDWSKFRLSYAHHTNEALDLTFIMNGVTEGWWIDNIRVYDVNEPEFNLISDGNFEKVDQEVEETVAEDDAWGLTEFTAFDIFPGSKTVDGDLSDWEDKPFYQMTDKNVRINNSIAKDVTIGTKFSYDEDNLYFAAKVHDKTHVHTGTNTYWGGDSLQLRYMGTTDRPSGTEFAIIFLDDEERTAGIGTNIQSMATRDGEYTYYECAIPWSVNFKEGVPQIFPFNAILNNNDGDGRAYWMQFTAGIGERKAPELYKNAVVYSPLGNIYHSVNCPEEYTGEGTAVEIYLKNPSKKAATVQLGVEELEYTESVTLQPGENQTITLPLHADEPGSMDLSFSIRCGGEEYTLNKSVATYYNKETLPELQKKLSGYMTELGDLIAECESKGIHTDYEVAARSLYSHFMDIIKYEDELGDYSRTLEYDRALTDIYQETKDDLLAYLSGEKEAFSVPRYVLSDLELDGTAMYGLMEENGVVERKPVFLTGQLSFGTVTSSLPFHTTIGGDFTSASPKMSHLITSYDPNGVRWFTVYAAENNPAVNKTTFSTTEDEACSGKRAINIKKEKTSGDQYMYLNQEVDVQPDTVYEFGLKAKGESNSRVYFSANHLEMEGRNFIYSSEDWKEYKSEITTKPDQHKIKFTILSGANSNALDLCIDDIYLREKGSDKNLIKNGDIEIADREQSEAELEAAKEGFYYRHYDLDKNEEVLKLAMENNVVIDAQIGIWTFPSWVYELDPEIKSSHTQFTPFALDHPIIRKLAEFTGKVLLHSYAKYDCVKHVLIHNEVQVYPGQGEHFIPKWQAYIKEKYGTVEALNENYGTDYPSFEDVKMPISIEATPLYYDYIVFARGILGDYLNWFADVLRAEKAEKYPDANIFISCKMMGYFRESARGWINNSSDYPTIRDHMDLNECDTTAVYGTGTTLMDKFGFYDYLTSMKDAPVFDTEMHPLADTPMIVYDDFVHYYCESDLWNSAFHGLAAGKFWLWEMDQFGVPWGTTEQHRECLNTNFAFRPRAAYRLSQTMLDMKRLAEEIVAVQKRERKVGFLFSRNSLIYCDDAEQSARDSHAQILYSGQKARFIDDATPKDIHQCQLLIVPEAPNVTAEMIQEIKQYLENGGQVLILKDNALRYDEYNHPHNQEDIDYIYRHADTTHTISEKIEGMNLNEVVLVDAATGKLLDNMVEWQYAEKDGKMLLNILNYDTENIYDVKILYRGEEVQQFKDLRANETLGNVLTLKTYQPLFVEF